MIVEAEVMNDEFWQYKDVIQLVRVDRYVASTGNYLCTPVAFPEDQFEWHPRYLHPLRKATHVGNACDVHIRIRNRRVRGKCVDGGLPVWVKGTLMHMTRDGRYVVCHESWSEAPYKETKVNVTDIRPAFY